MEIPLLGIERMERLADVISGRITKDQLVQKLVTIHSPCSVETLFVLIQALQARFVLIGSRGPQSKDIHLQ